MGISWLVALKAVPWTDLVQAAPGIVKGARKLYTTVRGSAGKTVDASPPDGVPMTADGVEARVRQIENRLAALMGEQQASAEVIRSLAEQNARLIEAVGIMRARARVVLVLGVVSMLGCLALAVLVVTR